MDCFGVRLSLAPELEAQEVFARSLLRLLLSGRFLFALFLSSVSSVSSVSPPLFLVSFGMRRYARLAFAFCSPLNGYLKKELFPHTPP